MSEITFQIGGRQTGKTTAMLDWMQDAPEGDHRVLVCHTGQEAMRLLRESRERGLDLESWQFVGYDELKPGTWSGVLHGRGGRVVLGVDNLDLILGRLLGWPVERVTATGVIA